MTTLHLPKGKRKNCERKSRICKPGSGHIGAPSFGVTTSEVVIYSGDANARNHRISEDLLWLERRSARRAGQIQSSIHRKGHYPESRVPLGNGDQEWTTAFALCRNQWAYARRHQRRGSRTILDR